MVRISCSAYAAPYASSAHTSISPHRGLGTRTRLVRLRRTPVLVVPTVARRVAQVRFEHLADVHTARHTERVEHDVDRRAVVEVGHVLDRKDLGDHTLVAVTAGELV